MTNLKGRHLSILQMLYTIASLCGMSMLLSSCGSSAKNVELAQQGVELFHAQFDTEQFTAIYASCDEKFHGATREADFVKLLDAVHRKLGTVQQSNLRSTGVAWFAGQGATVTLVYETKFTEGIGSEKFVWHVKDGGAALYGYNINSNALITN